MKTRLTVLIVIGMLLTHMGAFALSPSATEEKSRMPAEVPQSHPGFANLNTPGTPYSLYHKVSVPEDAMAKLAVVTVGMFRKANRPIQTAYVAGIVEVFNVLGFTCDESFLTVDDMATLLRENPAVDSSSYVVVEFLRNVSAQEGCYFSQDSASRRIRESFRPPDVTPARELQLTFR
ncbi:MAG: hypothetical protein ACE5JQ_09245 [Candidatus Methylomirabilales bacterium]